MTLQALPDPSDKISKEQLKEGVVGGEDKVGIEQQVVEESLMGDHVVSELWGEWTEKQVKAATLLWVEQFVIGLKLCPFAAEAVKGLRVSVSSALDRDMALDKFDLELRWIVGLDKSSPACTLIVYPPNLFEHNGKTSPLCSGESSDASRRTPEMCQGFEGFMSLATDAREMAQQFNAAHGQDIETETLLLTFHPNSTFSDSPSDPADFALRSPFPTVLILRGTDVRNAEEICEQQGRVTEDIAIANEARLRQVGYEELSRIFTGLFSSSRTSEAQQILRQAQEEREAVLASSTYPLSDPMADGIDGIDGQDLSHDPVELIHEWGGDASEDTAWVEYPARASVKPPPLREEEEEGGEELNAQDLQKVYDPFGYGCEEENGESKTT